MKNKIIIAFLFLFIAGIAGQQLYGIPAFARKYRMSCKTCHNPFPRLKPYGDEFAGDGFVLKDQDAPRYTVDTGDDQLSLIRDFPVAVRLEGHLVYNNSGKEKIDFATPYLLKFLSGGAIAKNLSYYFYFYMNERGKVAGVEDAFIQFTDIFGTGVALAVGQFQVSDPLFKRELRLTFEDYGIYKAKPGKSNVNLAYDRGIMLSYGFNFGLDVTAEVINGCGIEEADVFKNFDTDKYKNLFGRLSQGLGDNFWVGAFGYYGKEKQDGSVNRVWMAGLDASITFPTLELNLQYIERGDDNPLFFRTPLAEDYKIRGGFAELIWLPRGDNSIFYGVGLLNWIDYGGEWEYQSGALHLGIMLRRNFRLVFEFAYIFKDLADEYARFGVGLITAL